MPPCFDIVLAKCELEKHHMNVYLNQNNRHFMKNFN
jgi:hypothetical protein